MAFTPTAEVHLLDVPIDNKYKHQLYFNNAQEQYNYFYAQKKHTFINLTYQRKSNSIKVNEHIDNLWNVNYVMYKNANFSNKIFYAFINRMEYVSEQVTEIFIETDVYQTWLFECTVKKSFVVREHVALDTIGSSIMDEQLEIGDYLMNDYQSINKMGDNWNVLVTSDNSPLGVFNQRIGNIYGNIVTGCTYLPFPNTAEGINWLKDTIATYDEAGKPDALVMIFTVPHLLIKTTVDDADWELGLPISTGSPYGEIQFDHPKKIDNIDGYIPKNKKLFTFPYNFFYVSNNLGQSTVFHYEDFTHPTNSNLMRFLAFGSVSPDPVIMLAPCNYKGINGTAFEYGMTMKGFPLGSWQSDTYTAWFAQNVGSLGVTLAGSSLAIVGGALTGNALAVGGGALAIASEMVQISQAKAQPDQARGQIGNNSLMYSAGIQDFFSAHMSIKKGYAKKIDDFFTMFGYKVNALKVPEIHTRQQWNYIQTIDVNIDGAIPSEDMQTLKKIYDSGVTLWHNPANFLNYDLVNYIGSNYNVPPTVTGATTSQDGTFVTIAFSENMQTPDTNYWGFNIRVNGEIRDITLMNHPTPQTFNAIVSPPIVYGNVVTVSYTKGEVIAEDFGILASFTNRAVTNNANNPNQEWANYPVSPVPTSEYPHQAITLLGGTPTLWLGTPAQVFDAISTGGWNTEIIMGTTIMSASYYNTNLGGHSYKNYIETTGYFDGADSQSDVVFTSDGNCQYTALYPEGQYPPTYLSNRPIGGSGLYTIDWDVNPSNVFPSTDTILTYELVDGVWVSNGTLNSVADNTFIESNTDIINKNTNTVYFNKTTQ